MFGPKVQLGKFETKVGFCLPNAPVVSGPTVVVENFDNEILLPNVASGFSPGSISGLQGWWDMSDLSAITEVSGDVSQLDDKSGSGNHMAQGTGSFQPRTGDSSQNGLNVLTFNGSTDFLTAGSPSNLVFGTGDFTVLGVFKKLTTSNRDTVFGYGGGNTGGERYELLIHDQKPRAQFDDNAAKEEVDSGVVVTGTWVSAISLRRGLTQEVWVDGAIEGTNGLSAGYDIQPNFPADIGAMTNAPGSPARWEYFDGDIGEVLVYNKALSTSEIADLETYFVDKWGI